jgi:hypothetical protein
VVADREADTWASLKRWPLGHGPLAPGPHSPVLRHTAEELGRIGGSQQLEG